jgi:hypothetical protein
VRLEEVERKIADMEIQYQRELELELEERTKDSSPLGLISPALTAASSTAARTGAATFVTRALSYIYILPRSGPSPSSSSSASTSTPQPTKKKKRSSSPGGNPPVSALTLSKKPTTKMWPEYVHNYTSVHSQSSSICVLDVFSSQLIKPA